MTSDTASADRFALLPRSPRAAAAIPRMFGYRSAMPGVHRGLPSPWLTLVFPLSGELPIEVTEGGVLRSGRYAMPVGGLHTRPVFLPPPGAAGSSCGVQRGVQLDVHPLAARTLFGLPAGALAGQVLDLDVLLGAAEAGRLTDELSGGVSPQQARAVVAAWIDDRLGDPAAVRAAPEVRQAWRLIVGSGGRRLVGDVAREVGWSRRHLTAQLRAETGLGAKDIARVTRFARARSMIVTGRYPLADVAADCGYSDQSHLSTEWREFAGCTIGEWAAQELPWLSQSA